MSLEQRVSELEKKVAILEVRIPEQPQERFTPEDSNGKQPNEHKKRKSSQI